MAIIFQSVSPKIKVNPYKQKLRGISTSSFEYNVNINNMECLFYQFPEQVSCHIMSQVIQAFYVIKQTFSKEQCKRHPTLVSRPPERLSTDRYTSEWWHNCKQALWKGVQLPYSFRSTILQTLQKFWRESSMFKDQPWITTLMEWKAEHTNTYKNISIYLHQWDL